MEVFFFHPSPYASLCLDPFAWHLATSGSRFYLIFISIPVTPLIFHAICLASVAVVYGSCPLGEPELSMCEF